MDLQIKSSRIVLATESAVKKLNELKLAEDAAEIFLRMGVKPGGCSGYSYEMFFDTDRSDDDVEVTFGDVSVIVDTASADLLVGATLDYKDGLDQTGFSIDNPSAQRTCGCGKSFS